PSYLRPATNPTTSGCSSAWALQPEPTRSASSIDASPDSSGISDSPEPDSPESDWDSEFSDSEPPESEPMPEQPLSARSPMAPAEMRVAVRVRSWVFIVVLLESGELVGTAVEVASRGCCVHGIRSRIRIGWVFGEDPVPISAPAPGRRAHSARNWMWWWPVAEFGIESRRFAVCTLPSLSVARTVSV